MQHQSSAKAQCFTLSNSNLGAKASLPYGWKGQENNPLLTPAQPWDEMLTAGKHLLAPAELGFPLPSFPDTQPRDHTAVPTA